LITTDARNFRKAMTYEQWKDLGVVSDIKLPPKTLFQLVKPDGTSGPAYLVSNNYQKLLHWNRSLRFAIAAGLFSDQLRHD
jgi:membrane-bound lytic murein transglycosylase B